MKKNVAGQSIGCQMLTAADGSEFTGSVTVTITGDNGTQTTGSVGSGACTHEGHGWHSYAPAQAETNFDHVAFTFFGTGALTATVQLYPTFPQSGDGFARLGSPAGASVSVDVAAIKTDTAAVKTKTDFLPSATAGTAGGVFIAGTNAATTVTTALTTTFTGNLTGSVASVTGAVGSVTGAVGSVTGAVGSVTGNVGGNVTGSVGSVATGGIAAASFAANAITAAKLDPDVTTELQAGLATATALTTVEGKIDTIDTNVDAILVDTAEIGAAGAGLTAINLPDQTMNITGDITGNLSGSVGSVTGAVGSVAGLTASDVGAIKIKTDALPTDPADQSLIIAATNAIAAAIAALENLSAAEVNAEIVDALATDTYAEPGQGAPAATTTLAVKINFLYKALRNKFTQDGSTFKLYADDATTVDQKATVSDDTTTFTRGELGTGP